MGLSHVQVPSNRTFGFFFTAVLLIAGLLFLRGSASLPAALSFGAAALLLIVTLTRAELLFPLNKAWAMLGHLLGLIVSPIVLGAIFFGLFTPLGLLMRAFGRDELRLRRSAARSHWRPRPVDDSRPDAFKYQF